MSKKGSKPHYENGLISDLRDKASRAKPGLKKKALAESKKAKVKNDSVFARLTATQAKRLLSL